MEMTYTCRIIDKTENCLLRIFTYAHHVIESKWIHFSIHFFCPANFRYLIVVWCWMLEARNGVRETVEVSSAEGNWMLGPKWNEKLPSSVWRKQNQKQKQKREGKSEVTLYILIKISDPLLVCQESICCILDSYASLFNLIGAVYARGNNEQQMGRRRKHC